MVVKGDRQPRIVELEAWIDDAKILQPLRDAGVFRTARVGFGGAAIVWGRAVGETRAKSTRTASSSGGLQGEQAGELLPTASFRAWHSRNALTVTAAAEALGLSRRRVGTYYDSGAWPGAEVRDARLRRLGGTAAKGSGLGRHQTHRGR